MKYTASIRKRCLDLVAVHGNDIAISQRFVAWWADVYKLTFKKSFDSIIHAGSDERHKDSKPRDMYDLTELTGFGQHPVAALQFHLDSLVPKAGLQENNLFAGSSTTVETLGIQAESPPQRSIKTSTPNNPRQLFRLRDKGIARTKGGNLFSGIRKPPRNRGGLAFTTALKFSSGSRRVSRQITGGTLVRMVDDRVNRERTSHWLRLPIERMPLAYIEFDRDARLLEWNPAAERIFGYAKPEAVGRIVTDLILPAPPNDHISDILNRIWTGDFNAHSVNANRTKDGRIIECDWFNTPILDSDGDVTGGISFAREITVRRYLDLSAIELDRVRDRDLALLERMTSRQREVLRLVSKGRRTRDIAKQLKVSVKTIEMHRARVMDTLEIHDVPGLTRFAIRVGLISAYD